MSVNAVHEAVAASAVMQIAAAQLAAFLALLLIASAAHKSLSATRARLAAAGLAGVSPRWAALLVAAAAAAELSAGCLLLVTAWRLAGALIAAAIWSLYGAALAFALARGKTELDCGCSFGEADRRLGAHQALRAFALAGLATFVASAGTRGAATPPATAAAHSFWAIQLLAAAGMLGLYVALDQVMALRPLRAGVVR